MDRVSDNLLQQHFHYVFQYFSTDGLKKKRDSVSQKNETPAACARS